MSPAEFVRAVSEEQLLLVDARSPAEYARAHFPGAVNIPLMDDEERRQVGITYKSNGRDAAVVKGFDLVGKKFGDFVRTVRKHTGERRLLLYCWRGGMRSGIMSWVLETAGYKTVLLKGGYKAFRDWVLHQLTTEKRVVIVGGKTGSGKTELLQELRMLGEQVICLETLARHRGSAFGAMGMEPSPRNEMFQNQLALEWNKADASKTLWMENESQLIGPILIPPPVFDRMRRSPVVEIDMERSERIRRIIAEYGKFPLPGLEENTLKLAKRLGGLRTREALEALREGRMEKWVEEMLFYYDKTYEHSLESRENKNLIKLECDGDLKELAGRMLRLHVNV